MPVDEFQDADDDDEDTNAGSGQGGRLCDSHSDSDDSDDDDDGQRVRPFSQSPQELLILGQVLQEFRTLSPEERAYVVANLMNMASSPDIPVSLNENSSMSEFELRSANFVLQRFISAIVKLTMDSVLTNLATVSYEFAHPANIARNSHKIQQRFLSVLLGYDYPYLVEDRPRGNWHLKPTTVIRYLYRHRNKLLSLMGPDKDALMTVDGTTEEADIHMSPLFAAVKERLQ